MDPKRVEAFWNEKAQDPSLNDSQVTHPDTWQRWLEIERLKQFLIREDRVLDVGCGAGYATRLLAPGVTEMVGVDRSPAMIARAIETARVEPIGNLRFQVADVLDLSADICGVFDVVMSVRCLINLDGWELQQRGLRAMASTLRPGGRLILVEGSAEGRTGLNALRTTVGLDPMKPVWHNWDISVPALLEFLAPTFELAERHDSGVYDLLARVAHPLLVAPEAPRYDARINEIAARIASVTDGLPGLGRVFFLALRKRDS